MPKIETLISYQLLIFNEHRKNMPKSSRGNFGCTIGSQHSQSLIVLNNFLFGDLLNLEYLDVDHNCVVFCGERRQVGGMCFQRESRSIFLVPWVTSVDCKLLALKRTIVG